jgi:hypothetical protein
MKWDNTQIKNSQNFFNRAKKNPVQKNYGPGPFDWSKFHSNRTYYRWEINVLIFFKFWREYKCGPATPSREGRSILHYHLMIVEVPRNHYTTFWPKQKSCQLAFNLTFFYPNRMRSSKIKNKWENYKMINFYIYRN